MTSKPFVIIVERSNKERRIVRKIKMAALCLMLATSALSSVIMPQQAAAFESNRSIINETLVSISTDGVPDDSSNDEHDAMSGDGRYVVFDSGATTFSPFDRSSYTDIYLRD